MGHRSFLPAPPSNDIEDMEYNFDEQISRRGTCSVKWDIDTREDMLPMWVADMDFRTAPAIIEAVKKRVEHGVFGYTHVPDSYYQAVIDWFSRRHGWRIDREWIIYLPGIVPALSAIVKAMTAPGDKVLIQTPVYNCFFSSVRNNDCTAEESPLLWHDNTYTIDFEDLERKSADPLVKVMILCNPHNPAGRVWTREELTRIGEICLRNNVFVIADEIHCELVAPGQEYTPFASISEDFLHNCATCVSPTKAFNIAGLQIANIVCQDEEARAKIDRAININEVCDVNPLGVVALQAAYNECGDWLDELNVYLHDNYLYMKEFCDRNLPDYPLARLEGTYLVWMDCRRAGMTSAELAGRLKDEASLWLNAGTMYGKDGEGFMRWNIACPRASLQDGLSRFRDFAARL